MISGTVVAMETPMEIDGGLLLQGRERGAISSGPGGMGERPALGPLKYAHNFVLAKCGLIATFLVGLLSPLAAVLIACLTTSRFHFRAGIVCISALYS